MLIHSTSSIQRNLQRGFTLLEICIAMAVGSLLIGVAVMGISSVNDQNALDREASLIEITARESMIKAVMDQHPIRIEIPGGLGVEGTVTVKRYGEKAFRKPVRGEFWEFSPTGICEPLELHVVGQTGSIEMGFDPLTGCARNRSVIVKG